MFQGAIQVNLDPKSRMAIPVKQRNKLVSLECNQITVTAHPNRCLLVYPMSAWDVVYKKIMAFPSLDPQAAGWRRMLLGHAETLDMDAAGRILLSATLRDFAKIEKSMMLVGQGNYLELWNEDAWHAQTAAFNPDGPMPGGIADFSL